ncbi:non-homologous end-joining DNA ligase [Catellatospora paridis]|uniref:non-homologous end-joining DNA ligase n=1 Tax=Catellatospora paridis TaxID=1617086 RepID=UPI0012D3C194|nr:non-homologous end-joining DNA ligase [Catellatospora paridis]
MADKLAPYRGKRSAVRTPEPVPAAGPLPRGHDDTFVIQEHHARALHWDFRLEHGGVLVSWAVPKGLPLDPKDNRLAVHTEDHPLEYADFAGHIPAGEYGAGEVSIWDRGAYELEKWTDDEVKVVLHGQRVEGRYVLIHTKGTQWLMHRMDPPPADRTAPPDLIRPMMATLGELPPKAQDGRYGYELKWDGVRAVVYAEGGRVRALSRNDLYVTAAYPELRAFAEALGSTTAVFDGELVAFDRSGRISFGALQPRMHVQDAARVRRLAAQTPVTYVIFDLLHLDGRDTTKLPYRQRRELLEGLGLSGAHWDTPPYTEGGGTRLLETSREQGLEGVVAKLLDSAYEPGRRSRAWIKVKNLRTQEVVVAGWRPGQGNRADTIGALLLGIPGPDGLRYVGSVGTGFTRQMLDDLRQRLSKLERSTSPFAEALPTRDAKDAHWVTPKLVGEVRFTEWTRDGRLRHPAWRGLRPDKSPSEVVPES